MLGLAGALSVAFCLSTCVTCVAAVLYTVFQAARSSLNMAKTVTPVVFRKRGKPEDSSSSSPLPEDSNTKEDWTHSYLLTELVFGALEMAPSNTCTCAISPYHWYPLITEQYTYFRLFVLSCVQNNPVVITLCMYLLFYFPKHGFDWVLRLYLWGQKRVGADELCCQTTI